MQERITKINDKHNFLKRLKVKRKTMNMQIRNMRKREIQVTQLIMMIENEIKGVKRGRK